MKRSTVLGLWGLLVGATAQAAGVNPDEYAFGAALGVDGQSALYSVALPQSVYSHTFHGDLLDLCVINGSNEVVPFEVRRAAATRQGVASRYVLPIFPLRGRDREPSDALKVRLQSANTSIDISQSARAPESDLVGAYLLDARGINTALQALQLQWPAEAVDFAARLQIESSEDLQSWSTVVAEAPVVNLHFGGRQFARAEINVRATQAPYWRLSWVGTAPKVALAGVSADPVAPLLEVTRQTATAPGRATPAVGEYEFDLQADLPVERLNLRLPEANTLVDVEFLALNAGTKTWGPIARGRLHRLQVPDAPDLTNDPVAIPLTAARHWRVRISQAGGGLGAGVPELVVGWLPHDLVFMARGDGPFRLLYGNASATPYAVAVGNLGGVDNPQGVRISARTAILGEATVLGGLARLTPIPPAPDWKRYVLWAILLLAVAALATMAWRLIKAMG